MKKFVLSLLASLLVTGAAMAQPAGATLTHRSGNLALYVSHDSETGDEMNPYVSSVWLVDENAGTQKKLLTTNPKSTFAWWDMARAHDARPVPLNDIIVAERAMFCPYDSDIVLVEGCCDARNTFTVMINTATGQAWHLPSTSGLVGFAAEDGLVLVESYAYYAGGGRYSVIKAFTTQGKWVNAMDLKMP